MIWGVQWREQKVSLEASLKVIKVILLCSVFPTNKSSHLARSHPQHTLKCHCWFPKHVRVFQQLRLISVDCDDLTASVKNSAVAQPEVTHRTCKDTTQHVSLGNLGSLQFYHFGAQGPILSHIHVFVFHPRLQGNKNKAASDGGNYRTVLLAHAFWNVAKARYFLWQKM